jgi:hypothetical protein
VVVSLWETSSSPMPGSFGIAVNSVKASSQWWHEQCHKTGSVIGLSPPSQGMKKACWFKPLSLCLHQLKCRFKLPGLFPVGQVHFSRILDPGIPHRNFLDTRGQAKLQPRNRCGGRRHLIPLLGPGTWLFGYVRLLHRPSVTTL